MFAKCKKAALAAGAALCLHGSAGATNAGQPTDPQWRDARAAAAAVAAELAAVCPLSAPGDQGAFDDCRKRLYGDSLIRAKLDTIVLWGRQKDPNLTLKASSLTQFAPDVLTGMYIPLFMFNGKHSVRWDEGEKLFQFRLSTAFRNRLAPGQFPYPFWHEDDKWSTYQNANEVLLWWDPERARVKVAQFTRHGAEPPLLAVHVVPPPKGFDGQWMWSDAQGKTQPKVTLFDGLFRSDNPYIGRLDGAYKALALRLREGQCDSCHVPDNPDKSKRLVLLQTPAHAAGEVQRLLKAVREDRMPRDETGIESPLDAGIKKALLEDGEAFAKLVEAAKRWETQTRQASSRGVNNGE